MIGYKSYLISAFILFEFVLWCWVLQLIDSVSSSSAGNEKYNSSNGLWFLVWIGWDCLLGNTDNTNCLTIAGSLVSSLWLWSFIE